MLQELHAPATGLQNEPSTLGTRLGALVQAESEQRFFSFSAEASRVRESIKFPRTSRDRVHVTPDETEKRDLGSRLVSARLGISEIRYVIPTQCANDSDRGKPEWVLTTVQYYKFYSVVSHKCA